MILFLRNISKIIPNYVSNKHNNLKKNNKKKILFDIMMTDDYLTLNKNITERTKNITKKNVNEIGLNWIEY